MSEGDRGASAIRPSRVFGGGLAVLLTTAACGALAYGGSMIVPEFSLDPLPAATAGFIGSSLVAALRLRRARENPVPASASVSQAAEPAPYESTDRPSDRMTRVDVADLAEAIDAARISRIIVPMGADGRAGEAVALARRLSAKRASTVFVDFGANGIAQEMGLIDAPADLAIIAGSPASFAHSIHRDRSSRAHVIAADLVGSALRAGAATEAATTVLEALGEAYARTVVAMPADRLSRMPELIHADTAIVVPIASVGEPATRALLDELGRSGVDDVVLVVAEAEARRFAVA